MTNSGSKKSYLRRSKTSLRRRKKSERIGSDAIEQRKPDDQDSKQEERYKTLVENIPCAVYSAFPGETGPTTFMPKNWKDWTGCSAEEFYQDPEAWPKCIYPDDREKAVNAYIEACRNEAPYNLEYRIVHRDTGQVRYVRDQGLLSKDTKGTLIRVDGIITDITELKTSENELVKYRDHLEELVKERTAELDKANEVLKLHDKKRKKVMEALRQSEQLLRSITSAAKDAIVMADSLGNISYWNPAAENLFGYQEDEVIGESLIGTVFSESSADVSKERLEQFGKTGTDPAVGKTSEMQAKRKDGTEFPIELSLSRVKIRDQWYSVGIMRDISQRRRTEQALRESEEKYRRFYEDAPLGYQSLDASGNFLDVNREWLNILGYSKEEVIGRFFADFVAPESLETFVVNFPRFKEGGKTRGTEFEMIKKDGSRITVSFDGNVEYDEEGHFRRTHCIMHDITDRKKAEEELRQYDHIVSSSADMLALLDKRFVYMAANSSYVKAFGKTSDEVIGHTVSEVFGKEFFETVIKPNAERCLAGEEVNYQAWFDFPAYEPKYMNINYYPYIDINSEVSGFVVNGRNITERKKAEEALQMKQNETEALLTATRSIPEKKTFEEAARGIFDAAKGLLGADSGYVALLSEDGRQNEVLFLDAGGRQCVVDPNLPMPIRGLRAEAYSKGVVVWENSFPVSKWEEFMPDGHVKLDNVLFAPIIIGGKAVGTIGLANKPGGFVERDAEMAKAFSDIAAVGLQFARDQEALRQSERKYRSLIANIPDVVWTSDEKGNTTFISENIKDIHGYSQDEIYDNGDKLWFGRIHPDDLEKVTKSFKAVFEKGEQLDLEYRIRRKDGQWIWIRDRSIGAYEKDGVKYADGILCDITERKKTEEAMKKSVIIIDSTTDAVFTTDIVGNITFWNKGAEIMYSYQKEEAIGKPISILYKDEDLHVLDSMIADLLEGKDIPGIEATCIDKNQQDIEILLSLTSIRDEDGNITELVGITKDITEHKKAEEKLLDYQAKLKSLASQLSVTEESERRRIATELHDQIGQSLVFSKLKLDELQQSVTSNKLTKALDEICNNIGQVIQDTRTLTFDLSSPILNELGFEAAVTDWLDVQIREKHGIKTEFEDDGQPKPLDDDIQALLFRNVRELLFNVVKHANAQNVKVSVRKVDDLINISVEDNGEGFDPAEVASKATFGLFSIRERLEHLGGSFEIKSESGSGSKITMTAPLK